VDEIPDRDWLSSFANRKAVLDHLGSAFDILQSEFMAQRDGGGRSDRDDSVRVHHHSRNFFVYGKIADRHADVVAVVVYKEAMTHSSLLTIEISGSFILSGWVLTAMLERRYVECLVRRDRYTPFFLQVADSGIRIKHWKNGDFVGEGGNGCRLS
jgi:hypothetical protein